MGNVVYKALVIRNGEDLQEDVMDEDLKNLAMLPWASTGDLAGFRYVDRTTVSRKEKGWTDNGLVVVKHGGRLVRPVARLLSSTGGLLEVFPQEHVHRGPAYNDHHQHHPLHPELVDHQHPTFFHGYNGALDLWEKLERVELWYPVAPEVLLGEGAAWTHDHKARRILSWRWLRNTRFIEAVATYEGDYRIFFGHIGWSVTESMLQYRWRYRFPDVHDVRLHTLVLRSRSEWGERLGDKSIDPPDSDLDYNPQPSAYVISTPDMRGVELARRVLPRNVAYLYLVGPPPSQRFYLGRAEAAPHDDVADPFETLTFGDRLPQDLCP